MEIGQFLRCNSCFSKQDIKNSPFSLTSCGHIFCNTCLSKAGNTCLYCKKNNVLSLILTDSVSPQVKYVFEPLENSFEQLRLAFIFQKTQSQITHQRLVNLEKMYPDMVSQFVQMCQENKLLKTELKFTQENLDKYKQYAVAASSAQANSTFFEANDIQSHMVFYPSPSPTTETQPNNKITSLIPLNQRLHTVRMTPSIIKKSKKNVLFDDRKK